MRRFVIFAFFVFLILNSKYSILNTVLAGPQSTTYELQQWGFGSGGDSGITSTNYSLFGTAGEIDSATAESTTYRNNPGLIFTMQSYVPPAPTFTNPGSNYDRLKIVINTANNPMDAQFTAQIALNTDTFWNNAQYVQNDGTVGPILGSEDWMKYSTGAFNWGGASGMYITGLTEGTVYKIRVKARHGNYTESGWGPSALAATVYPSLTFGIDAASITFSNLNPGNSYTDSSKSTVLTTSTNAYNGYIVYGRDTQPLTFNTNTIANYTSPNSSPTAWSGSGFGYSTNDSNLSGGTADRFTNGGPKYAGFGTSAPGDPVADHSGPILSPISSEQFTVSYRVTATSTTPPGPYQSTVLYVVVPTY